MINTTLTCDICKRPIPNNIDDEIAEYALSFPGCTLPGVITAGAALTAMHFVLLKIVRQEEGYITADFLRSFRQNFRQATAVWSLFLLFAALLVLDFFLTGGSDGTGRSFLIFVRYMLAGAGIFAALVFLYVFPLLARFENTVAGTIRNAARLAISSPPRTLVMALVTLSFPAAARIIPAFLPVEMLFGLTGPGFLCALMYSPVFLKIEEKIKSQSG